jgi:hypothetical protein
MKRIIFTHFDQVDPQELMERFQYYSGLAELLP